MGFKDPPPRREPANNPSEEKAKRDYDWEKNNTGKEPIPKEPPDWAKGIPSPKP